jgi:hypothetical protein
MERSEKGVIRGSFSFCSFFGFQIRLTGLWSDSLRPPDEIDPATFVFGVIVFQRRRKRGPWQIFVFTMTGLCTPQVCARRFSPTTP